MRSHGRDITQTVNKTLEEQNYHQMKQNWCYWSRIIKWNWWRDPSSNPLTGCQTSFSERPANGRWRPKGGTALINLFLTSRCRPAPGHTRLQRRNKPLESIRAVRFSSIHFLPPALLQLSSLCLHLTSFFKSDSFTLYQWRHWEIVSLRDRTSKHFNAVLFYKPNYGNVGTFFKFE